MQSRLSYDLVFCLLIPAHMLSPSAMFLEQLALSNSLCQSISEGRWHAKVKDLISHWNHFPFPLYGTNDTPTPVRHPTNTFFGQEEEQV